MSGSLPRGVTPKLYAQLIVTAREKKAFTLVDTDGDALKESIKMKPSCIKPNSHELSRLVGRDLSGDKDILSACDAIHEKGIAHVLVSLGKDGLILSTPGKRLRATAPSVAVESTVGAGDSVVAGFILAHSQNRTLEECIRLACAAGTATAITPGTELCHKETVEEILPKVVVDTVAP
jgi:1-phosphofructokinase family hexose kinase